MPTLLFSVGPPGVTSIHDLLICLAKFDEDVSIEATPQFLRFSSLNISKTTHAAFTLSSSFFHKYHFSPGPGPPSTTGPKIWTCKIQNRALLAIFKRRQDQRDRDTALESCDCELQASPDQAECRLIFRLNCRQGVVKTYRLFYESAEALHAAFDRAGSANYWTVSSRTLRDVVEYFGPKTDQLDWYYQNGKVTFTSYTEKIQSGREILKQPMHTSVALERKDFDDFNVQEGLHIGMMVKDFRAIVAHAEAMRVHVTARYSRGNRPMQMTYEENGLHAEYTLMTRGTTNVPQSSHVGTPARDLSMQPVSRARENEAVAVAVAGPTTQTAEETDSATARPSSTTEGTMPPPARTSFPRQRESTAPVLSKPNMLDSTMAPSGSIDPNSLFIPADDEDDQQWDAPNFEEEPDIVTWDNTADEGSAPSSTRRIRDSALHSFASMQEQERGQEQRRRSEQVSRSRFPHEIAPTQRLSQVRGIFD
ncbi:hypothetical protein HRR83_006136 [Exophiala dermatitidis]|uniref:DNA repair protein rad9 n=2 Tax=Exophiala dermatitidis TaxID=5970 RepID=H6BME4_EXODN|nr:cell cycle checkpoint control protein RAD9B [Exophiala dermatitidis NIH/UT8656]KAJ4515068.1 hypothetical protein HRR74_005533 [Exophiala dermatitidis]EHY53025.1 cell cycle checkpoint control protein RAD9B [Exophiala dermatitidis NIH/UT8656]KAJ4517559.1 hypothetical protein HRR73_004611 [Exophiala dermatitidis]KAJ4548680.1 hypothetical protein HRR76_001269 [Exophiala dermatitidis]KAJ4552600.1 hypothetical protein HRR77_002601 [Exophiala dermatitidis]